jgi:hypothetical protein
MRMFQVCKLSGGNNKQTEALVHLLAHFAMGHIESDDRTRECFPVRILISLALHMRPTILTPKFVLSPHPLFV